MRALLYSPNHLEYGSGWDLNGVGYTHSLSHSFSHHKYRHIHSFNIPMQQQQHNLNISKRYSSIIVFVFLFRFMTVADACCWLPVGLFLVPFAGVTEVNIKSLRL